MKNNKSFFITNLISFAFFGCSFNHNLNQVNIDKKVPTFLWDSLDILHYGDRVFIDGSNDSIKIKWPIYSKYLKDLDNSKVQIKGYYGVINNVPTKKGLTSQYVISDDEKISETTNQTAYSKSFIVINELNGIHNGDFINVSGFFLLNFDDLHLYFFNMKVDQVFKVADGYPPKVR